MDMNLYKQTLDSIKVSDEALEKAFLILREKDTVGKAKMQPTKKHNITKYSIIAASLAVIMALGAIIIPNVLNRPDRSFTITANAAELNDKGFTTIGEFSNGAGGAGEYDGITHGFQADLRVIGDNIKSVRYDIDGSNAVFAIDSTKNIFIEKYNPVDWFNEWGLYVSNLMDPDENGNDSKYQEWLDSEEKGNRHTEYEAYKGYSVNYNHQTEEKVKSSDFDVVGIYSAVSVNEGDDIAEAVKKYIYDYPDIDKLGYNGKNIDEIRANHPEVIEYEKSIELLYSKMFNDVTVTVTVTYDDGTTGYQTIQLYVEDVKLDSVMIAAKVI